MNDNQRNQDQLIDLLVDGELDEARRGQLLTSLDDVPDGWRRCALAFLEGQAWKESVRAPAVVAAAPAVSIAPRASAWRFPRRLDSWLSIAASAVFGFGLAMGTDFITDRPVPRVSVAQAPEAPVTQSPDLTLPEATRPDTVTLVIADLNNRQARPIQVPVVADGNGGVDGLQSLPSLVPSQVIEELRRRGHRFERRREYLPVTTADGTDLVVPVDTLRVLPGESIYQ